MRDYSSELARAQELMDELLVHIRAFDARRLSFVPAVIETAPYTLWRGEDAQGLRKYIDGIEHHAAQLRSVRCFQPADASSRPRRSARAMTPCLLCRGL